MNQIGSVTDRKMIVNTEDIRIGIKVLFVSFVNVLYCSNQLISNIAVLIEIGILILDAVQNKWSKYFGDYILFCGLSIEFAVLTNAENIYGFKEFRIFGVNLGFLALLPLFVHYFLSHKSNGTTFEIKQKDFWNFARMYLLLIAVSAIMGLVLFVFNDNNVADAFTIRIFIEELYQKAAQPILLIFSFCFMSIREEKESFDLFEKYLLVTLYGSIASLVISFVFARYGNYGGVNTLVATNNVRWIPLLLIFPLYKKYKGRLFIVIAGIIGVYFLLRYNATGKNIMLCALLPLIYVFVSFRQHKYIRAIMIIAIIPIVAFLGLTIMSRLGSVSVLFNSKMNQVISMIGSLFTTSVANMEDSPRVRVLEFAYIIQEYIKKPYLSIFGKGLGGTILKGNLAYDLSSFSQEELSAGLIYNVHESVNKLFLSNGILGMYFLITTVIMGIKKMGNNPWIIIGLYWFLISLGHSITMSAFGLSCLMYGLFETGIENEEKIDATV